MRPSRRSASIAGLIVALTALPAAAQTEETELLGAPSALRGAAPDTVRLPPHLRLREAPAVGSATVAILSEELELEVVERRGGWLRVRFGERLLWANPSQDPGLARPPAPAPPAAPPAAADPERLERARRLLGDSLRQPPLGRFRLLTDLSGRRLLGDLDRVAAALPAAYSRRFGLAEPDPSGLAVALFRRERDYRAYADASGEGGDPGADGHAAGGVAALFSGGRPAAEVRSRLIHELAHLLNRRAFATPPEPWLEEAMAGDLAASRVTRDGRLLLGSVAGWSPAAGTVRRDPRSALALLADELDAGARPPLAELVRLDSDVYRRPEGRPLRALESAFLLRYLLDGEDARRAPALRRHLAALADGGPAPDLFEPGADAWAELERGFRTWLRQQAATR